VANPARSHARTYARLEREQTAERQQRTHRRHLVERSAERA
jgi:hypothetical protein